MKRKIYIGANLMLMLQQSEELGKNVCANGVISRNDEGDFRFEEAVRKGAPKRNPKLYDGEYISLVHMQNGKYQAHMKTINASGNFDRKELAKKVYTELVTAFQIID